MGMASLAAGFFTDTGMDHHAFLLVPYVLGIVFDGRLMWQLFKLKGEGINVREHIYRDIALHIPAIALGAVIAAAVSIITSAVLFFSDGYGGRGLGAVLFIVSQMVQLIGGAAIIRMAGSWDFAENSDT